MKIEQSSLEEKRPDDGGFGEHFPLRREAVSRHASQERQRGPETQRQSRSQTLGDR